jgi:hypothetical protein
VQAFNASFGGTPEKMAQFREMVGRLIPTAACGGWNPSTPWMESPSAHPVRAEHDTHRRKYVRTAPLRDRETPLEALITYCHGHARSQNYNIGTQMMLFVVCRVYGTHVAHALITWMMVMHQHRVLHCGDRVMEEARFFYANVQALAAQPDLSIDSVARANVSLAHSYGFYLLDYVLGFEIGAHGNSSGTLDAYGNVLPRDTSMQA